METKDIVLELEKINKKLDTLISSSIQEQKINVGILNITDRESDNFVDK